MKKLFAIFFILLFSFCSQKEKSPCPHLIVEETGDWLQINTNEMLGVHRNIFGWNFTNDTDNKSHVYEPYEKVKDPKKEKRQIYGDKVINSNFAHYDGETLPKADLKVIVDTTYTIGRNNFQYKNYYYPITVKNKDYINGDKNLKLYFDIIQKLEKQNVECYPVLIYNNSKESCMIGTSMIQEAKDIDGKWKPIEFIKRGLPTCFVSPIPVLFSKKYMGASVIKYHGNFKTKLRVKYVTQWSVYYSNEFTGYINKSQFSKAPYLEYYKRHLADMPMSSITLEEGLAFDFLDYQQYKTKFLLEP